MRVRVLVFLQARTQRLIHLAMNQGACYRKTNKCTEAVNHIKQAVDGSKLLQLISSVVVVLVEVMFKGEESILRERRKPPHAQNCD